MHHGKAEVRQGHSAVAQFRHYMSGKESMKIKLIFYDWQDEEFNSIYNTFEGNRISTADFHSGTTFDGKIKLDAEQEAELKEHMRHGYRPVFWAMNT